MPNYDFSQLSLQELKHIQKQVQAYIENAVRARKAELLRELGELDNLSSVEHSSGNAPKRKRKYGPLPPKYRSPDGLLTWAGKGTVPKWVAEFEAKGGSRQSLLIDP